MFARVVIVLLSAALLWAVFVRDTGASSKAVRYRVQWGDSLWSIAEERYGGDPRDAVWKLQQRNGLTGATIVPGQVLVLP